jgi:hypothetical protein
MFGSEIEYKLPLANSLRIAIVSYNISNIELATKIQEKIMISKKKKFQIIQVEHISDLFKYQENNKEEKNKGLIDKKWINNIINFIPSVIVLNYQIKPDANKDLEEKNLYLKLEEIRKNSEDCYIILIVIYPDMHDSANKLHLNFDDKQKPYCLKNYITKDCFYIFDDEHIWNYTKEFAHICDIIFKYSRKFYKNYKENFKEKRAKSSTREEKIENDIKIGILSGIKSLKEDIHESKYLEEAYQLLCDKNFNLEKYKYGNLPLKISNNFYEIRAAADWLFFKLNKYHKTQRKSSISSRKNKPNKSKTVAKRANSTLKNNINNQLEKAERHIKIFNNKKYYEKGKKDYFHFVEYFWLIQRYNILKEYIENIKERDRIGKKLSIKLGTIIFKILYNIIRMIQYYNENLNDTIFKLKEINNNNKTIEINDIEEEESIYFGKPPSYFVTDKNNSNEKQLIGFNDEIYIKKFILNNKLNYDEIINAFRTNYLPNVSLYYSQLIEEDQLILFKDRNNKDMKGIIMYLNYLKILGFDKNIRNININDIIDSQLYKKILDKFERIKKFPKVYAHFIKQYLNLIEYKMNKVQEKNNYKKKLFVNLSILGNIRKLDNNEEKLFYQLLNDTELLSSNNEKEKNKNNEIVINLEYYNEKNVGIIKCDELAFNINYSVKNIEKYQKRKLLDIVEYEIKINSSLSQEKLKLNTLKLFFEYSDEKDNNNVDKKYLVEEKIIKEFKKEELNKYELGFNSTTVIVSKLLLKHKTGKIILTKIMFTLCKKENIYYSIDIPYELNKAIFLNGEETNIVNIQYPKKLLTVGINQLFKFEYIINKLKIENIKITDYKHIFEIEQMNKNKLVSKIQDKINNKNKINNENRLSNTNDKEISQDTLVNFLFNDSTEKYLSFDSQAMSAAPSSIFFFNESKNCIEESKNRFQYIYNNFESRLEEGKSKNSVLIKFRDFGIYLIKLNLVYFIKHNEVDEMHDFHHEETFYVKVIDPLSLKSNITSNNYILFNNIKNEQTKVFVTNTNINMNLIFQNLLDEDIIIKDIIIKSNDNKDKDINTTIKDIIDSNDIEECIKEQILNIIKSSNYTIPFNVKFSNPYSGSLGKCKIVWTTESLKEFEKNKEIKKNNNFNFKNENEYNLTNIDVNMIKMKFDYKYLIKDNNEIFLNIKIYNNSEYKKQNKKLLVSIINSDDNSYIISGLTRYHINLKYGEMKKINLKLIVLQKGEMQLPYIIAKEIDSYGSGKVISTNYYYPEKMILH